MDFSRVKSLRIEDADLRAVLMRGTNNPGCEDEVLCLIREALDKGIPVVVRDSVFGVEHRL